MQTSNHIKKMWRNFLNILFPHNHNLNLINKLSIEEFLFLTKPAIKPTTPNTLSIISYKNKIVKKAIWSLKFGNNQSIAKLFAEIIYDNLIEELSELKLLNNFNDPILITIPLHKTSYKKRGYNQTDLIAKEIVQIDQNNLLTYKKGVLKKIKKTLPQSHIKNKSKRLKNLENCFKIINPRLIRNRNIILLDDVTTTGSTLTEAVQTLKVAQPKNIICVTLAH